MRLKALHSVAQEAYWHLVIFSDNHFAHYFASSFRIGAGSRESWSPSARVRDGRSASCPVCTEVSGR